MPSKPPDTLTVTPGELGDATGRDGQTLVWLWPRPGPAAEQSARVLLDPDRLAALTLRPGESLVLRRAAVDEPELAQLAGGWEICVPSSEPYHEVSRAPTRFSLEASGALVVETEASGPRRLWIDLAPLDGPARVTVPPWAAVGVGSTVLWHVPLDEQAAWKHVAPVPAPMVKRLGAPGFRCFSMATMDVVAQLRRRAAMRLRVPRSTTSERWEAGQPFILVGEAGCGKTTLAKAVYSVVDAPRFAAVHPVAVEQEVDLVALTGCRGFAHDGRRVPDQQGHLYVATQPDGVVLIDEVHTLNDRLKQHLTDILTEWTFRPRGDTTDRHKLRGLIVFATNQPDVLRDPGTFPHDLFARMGGEAGIIEVPPLRQRRWELPRLAAAVLDELEPPLTLDADATRMLLLHHWALNHWELEDAMREAHSLAASLGLSQIPSHVIKLTPPPAVVAVTVVPELAAVDSRGSGSCDQPGRAACWRFPAVVGWRELFVGLRELGGSFTTLRDTWQQQSGASNAATINRRIGRLIRCASCQPQSCTRCFSATLAQSEPAGVLEELERLGPAGELAWIAAALGELVVERTKSYATPAAKAALETARQTPDRDSLLTLLETLRGR